MRVAFVGLGNIGAPMARRLLAAGHAVAVHDASPEALQAFATSGARIAATAADAGRGAECAGVCVRDDAQLLAVVLGGAAESGRPGGPAPANRSAAAGEGLLASLPTGAVLVVHSTVRPATIAAIAAAAAPRGVDVLDAAVTGGAHSAATGDLCAMAGGDAAVLERARPYLAPMCRTIIHAGASGTGMVLKAANNLVTMLQLLAAHESVRLAASAGLDPALLERVMTANGNLTDTMRRFLEFRRTGPAQLGEAAFRGFQERMGRLGAKDLGVALGIAADAGIALPGAAAARELMMSVFLDEEPPR